VLVSFQNMSWPRKGEAAWSNARKSDWKLGIVLDFAEEGLDGAGL